MFVSGADQERLLDAVQRAFDTRSLERVLKLKLERDLDAITLGPSFTDRVFDLLNTANREGWVERLLVALCEARPENVSFLRVANEVRGKATVGRFMTARRMGVLAARIGEVLGDGGLRDLVRGLGRPLPADAPGGRELAFNVLLTALREDWLDDLVSALRRGALGPLAEAILRQDAAAVDGLKQEDAGGGEVDAAWLNYVTRASLTARTSVFRRLVERRAIDNALQALSRGLERCERQVCKIDIGQDGGSRYIMTGCLVAPDLVLTTDAYFTTEHGADATAGAVSASFWFDNRTQSDGTTIDPGVMVEASLGGWLVRTRGGLAVGDRGDKIGYALMRLARPVGREPARGSGSEPRGWLRLLAGRSAPPPGEPILIFQQSHVRELQIGTGRVTTVSDRLVDYEAMTLPGSTGGPCLDASLVPFALHSGRRSQGPASERAHAKYGLLLNTVVADLQSAGVPPFWEGDAAGSQR